jgi:uncharacterized protein (DUF58 family)
VRFAYRIVYWFYRLISGTRYRMARRFTRAGLLVLLAFVVAAMTGFDTENTVAYQAFAPLLILLVLALAGTWFFSARFSATRQLPRFGTAGRPFSYGVTVKNLMSKPQNDLTLLDDLADPRPSFPEWLAAQRAVERKTRTFRFSGRRASNPFRPATVKSAVVPSLRPNEETEVRVELTPLRRGAVRFAAVTLARTDPLGLSRAFSRLLLPQTVLILPKRYPLPSIALPGTLKYQEGGVALASNIGRSEEFVALRDYRRGDPLRHIHWRSWAKAGKPIVKEFEDEFFVRHALVLDTFTADPHSDAFEEAVSVAASFACTLQTQESLLDLLFVGPQAYCFTAGRGLADADQMLEILAAVRACGDKTFRELEHLVLNHSAVVSGCICVLLAWDAERRAFVEKLQALGVPLLVLVVCEAGKARSLEAGPLADKPGQFHVLEAGRIEEGLAATAGMVVG